MVIRASAAGEVERLAARLRSGKAAERDAAIARLRVIGPRIIDRVTPLITASAEPAAVRVAALRALEGIDDLRARTLALGAAGDPDGDVACAAIAVLRRWVTADAGVSVLEALTVAALDAERPSAVRLAALDAVGLLPRNVAQPLLQQFAGKAELGRDTGEEPAADDDPVTARDWLAAHDGAPLSTLHEFIVTSREHERAEASARRRQEWLITRGAAHAVLARRGSRVALYDLRETFDTAQAALPLDFLSAIAAIGDADCLEAMARAWAATPREGWWRDRLADAATDIINRLRLSGRSVLLKRLRAKYAGFV